MPGAVELFKIFEGVLNLKGFQIFERKYNHVSLNISITFLLKSQIHPLNGSTPRTLMNRVNMLVQYISYKRQHAV